MDVGPAAGDSVTAIPGQHRSAVAGVTALAVPALFAAALLVHCAHEVGRMS